MAAERSGFGSVRTMSIVYQYLFIIASVSLLRVHAQDNDATVLITAGKLGEIRGEPGLTFLTYKDYVRYIGIPYAKAPVDNARFMPPEPINERLVESGEVFNASSSRSYIKCVQPRFAALDDIPGRLQGKLPMTKPENGADPNDLDSDALAYDGVEDCLVLNVYTPKIPSNGGKNYPVIVFIHGGAFSSGYGSFYEPDRLLENDVVVVTVNYRLGVLGFFCLDTDEIPGNAAMYDLVVALQWVQSYIEHFGGNPDLVTVAGQSAGAVAVGYLMLSDMTQRPTPLFHRAIALSGSPLNSWAFTENSMAASLKIAQLANCTETEISAITACMRNADPDELVAALTTYQNDERRAGRLGLDAVSPVIQRSGDPKFLREHPVETLEKSQQIHVPLIMSATQHDGSFPLGVTYNRFLNCGECGDKLNSPEFLKKDLVPTLLRAMGIQDDTNEVYTALAEKYLKEARSSGNFSHMVYGLLDMHSVFFFKAGIQKHVQLHSRSLQPTYLSSFEYTGEYSLFELLFLGNLPDVPGGIAHGDDLLYLMFNIPLNTDDQTLSYKMVDQWTNFAVSGDPNSNFGIDVKWPAFTEGLPEYLRLKDGRSNAIEDNYSGSWADASSGLRPTIPVNPTTGGPGDGDNSTPTSPVTVSSPPATVSSSPATVSSPTSATDPESTTAESSASDFNSHGLITIMLTLTYKLLY